MEESAPKQNNPEIKERKNFKIIFAEDDEVTRNSLKMIFEFLGYSSVVSVKNGDELTERFLGASQIFDLLITDYHMPGKTGLEAIEIIRSMKHKIPIIMITARPDLITSEIKAKLGIVCLEKPATMQEIEDTIEKIRLKSKK